ncbi:MAG TPA: DUF2628 domain-containing protein [Methylovirgula sp.]|nr:DUF2628 domain-containing protein [Methylovirgula sp.]
MPVYTVHLPSRGFRSDMSGFALPGSAEPAIRPSGSAPSQAALVDAAFVPEGFSRAAFFLGPFWLAWHRLWLELLAWLVVFGLLASGALRFIGPGTSFMIGFLLQILLGLEGNNLRRGGLARRGYRLVDVAAGATRDDAERSFFRRSIESGAPLPAQAEPSAQPPRLPPHPQPDVLGLFPLPEDPR